MSWHETQRDNGSKPSWEEMSLWSTSSGRWGSWGCLGNSSPTVSTSSLLWVSTALSLPPSATHWTVLVLVLLFLSCWQEGQWEQQPPGPAGSSPRAAYRSWKIHSETVFDCTVQFLSCCCCQWQENKVKRLKVKWQERASLPEAKTKRPLHKKSLRCLGELTLKVCMAPSPDGSVFCLQGLKESNNFWGQVHKECSDILGYPQHQPKNLL